MVAQPQKHYSPEEYLALEETAEYRSEYYRGEIFAMGRTDTITNPAVIIEVLSESTQAYGRGAKFELYRAIETLQDYVLVDQSRVHVEYFHKLEDGRWLLTEFNDLEAVLRLESLVVEIPLSRVYQRVEWEN